MNNGTDGNTLMDDCTRSVPAGEQIPLISAPPQPTPMDSVYNVRCKPSFIELVFKKPIVCSSIAGDGSDFFITGPQTVTVTPVLPSCGIGPTTNIIRLDLSSNISVGTYQVVLRTGTDGNTIINECGVETPVNSMVSFVVSESVSAVFTNSSNTSCTQSQVSFLHNGANNVISWNWTFSNGVTSALPNPVVNFNKGNYTVRLIVSNGTCADTSNQVIKISDGFKADFDFPAIVCPGDLLTLTDKSTGNIDSWSWNFGNGQTSNVQNPPAFFYTDTGSDMLFAVKLVVSNSLIGCNDTSTHVIRKLKNCLIAVPSAFTPNNDGKNDFLYPLNAVKADQLEFKVYNRYGQLVFFTKDWTRKWDGRINGNLQDTGVFAWILTYTDRDTKEKIIKKGTSLLIR
jgi:gliding motility-associated-like protein